MGLRRTLYSQCRPAGPVGPVGPVRKLLYDQKSIILKINYILWPSFTWIYGSSRTNSESITIWFTKIRVTFLVMQMYCMHTDSSSFHILKHDPVMARKQYEKATSRSKSFGNFNFRKFFVWNLTRFFNSWWWAPWVKLLWGGTGALRAGPRGCQPRIWQTWRGYTGGGWEVPGGRDLGGAGIRLAEVCSP